jgi:hypothetical protein
MKTNRIAHRVLNTILVPVAAVTFIAMLSQPAWSVTYDLTADWSDAVNPNGVWTYREGANVLPHVNSWQEVLGGWSVDQPGWAESEDDINRLPFWFKSNGSETFVADWQAGDVVVHSTDFINGAGNDNANVLWTAPSDGIATITGGLWIGRDIGRAVAWSLLLNNVQVTAGVVGDSDPYDSSNPYQFSAGSGGASAVSDLIVGAGDTIELRFGTTLVGDFVVVDLAIDVVPVPEPSSLAMLISPLVLLIRRRT